MRTAILGTVLAVTAALAATEPAYAGSVSPVLVATCRATLSGTYSSPLDPGSTNAQQADTLQQSGTVTCVDDGGQPLVSGTVTRTTVLPAAQCSGIAYSDPSTTRITWADGTFSSISLDHANVVSVLGTASTAGTGSVSADSTKFTGDSIDGAVMGAGDGCGTTAGQRTITSTLVFTLAH